MTTKRNILYCRHFFLFPYFFNINSLIAYDNIKEGWRRFWQCIVVWWPNNERIKLCQDDLYICRHRGIGGRKQKQKYQRQMNLIDELLLFIFDGNEATSIEYEYHFHCLDCFVRIITMKMIAMGITKMKIFYFHMK